MSAAGIVSYTSLSLGRRPVIAGLASALAGALVAWVAMRGMMRWVALSSGQPPILTLEGTLAILGTALLMSILPALGYVHFRKRFGPSLRKSLAYGLILSALGGIPLILLLVGEISSVATLPTIPIMFLLGVPILFAVTIEATHRILSRQPTL